MRRATARSSAVGVVCLALAGVAFGQDIQQRRLAFIRNLQQERVFHKLERPAKLCHLWVGPKFGQLDFDTKAQFVNVVYAYCVTERPAEKIVVLKDFRTGKQVGTYADGRGLSLD